MTAIDRLKVGLGKARTQAPRDAVIHVRVPQKTRDLIAHAADLSHQTLTSFVLESAARHATDVVLDQRLFVLDEEQFDAFVNLLDNSPPPSERLNDRMARKAPWET